jgi:hypothetical protein
MLQVVLLIVRTLASLVSAGFAVHAHVRRK